MSGRLLVTGGAGYVGGFTVRALLERGEEVVILDNLSTGHRWAVPDGVELVEADLRTPGAVAEVFSARQFDGVLHFAANAEVGESVRNPRKYWENNVGATLALLGACADHGVDKFVFSSTCAVYGEPPESGYLHEDLPRKPVNPYGVTKSVIEEMLQDFGAAHGVRSFRLRYFNAAGAAEDGSVGEHHDPESHLIPLTMQAARGERTLSVFGTDWDTPDGTCVRDYVHVIDLADAHVRAVAKLRDGHAGMALNLGTGTGTSVKEVIDSVARISGREVPHVPADRRPGDPRRLVARPGKAADVLGWTPRYTSIDPIVETAWRWHSRDAS